MVDTKNLDKIINFNFWLNSENFKCMWHTAYKHGWMYQVLKNDQSKVTHPNQYFIWMWQFQQHYTDVIMIAMASEIISLTLVFSTDYSDQIKENIKAQCHWPLWGEFTGEQWIPRIKGQ